MLIGVSGGFYVVPLNALLQERGHETVGAGNAVAVQNFFENISMMALVGLYILMQKINLPIASIALIFGVLIFCAIGMLVFGRLSRN
jgi:LPLT family lysophospholipid transporter-like MFS transporter